MSQHLVLRDVSYSDTVLRLADCSARSLEQRLYLHDAGVLVHVDLLDGHARHVRYQQPGGRAGRLDWDGVKRTGWTDSWTNEGSCMYQVGLG